MNEKPKRRKGRGNVKIVAIPSWTIDTGIHDGAVLATALLLADLEDRWIRIAAKDQINTLGFPVFGKKAVFSNSRTGNVHIKYSACFGHDNAESVYTWHAVTNAAVKKMKLS